MPDRNNKRDTDYRAAAIAAARKADELKAENIEILHVEELFKLTDYFVLATCTSQRQQKALANELEEVLESHGLPKIGIEGTLESGWLLLDFDTVIVHLFLEDAREYYQIDLLWGDAEHIDWE